MNYFIRYGSIFDFLMPKRLWRKKTSNVYLTFDDGPTDNLTIKILEILEARDIKATFFCVGANVQKRQELTRALVKKGHVVANHTQYHTNESKVSSDEYFQSVSECTTELENIGIKTTLFRPPYGKLSGRVAKVLSKNYQIVMWSFLAGDFDLSRTPGQIIGSAKRVKSGDIIVFHDNEKFTSNVLESLPVFLDDLLNRGFKFGLL